MRVFLLIVAISASFHLRSSGATADKPNFPSSASPQAPNVATLYRVHCMMCHGPLGKAAIPEMAFIGRKWKHGTKSADMAKIITDGVKGTPMMAFKGKLKPDEIKALATHVRSFDKTLPPEK
jgi:mono/diheme cytochrome c family protein